MWLNLILFVEWWIVTGCTKQTCIWIKDNTVHDPTQEDVVNTHKPYVMARGGGGGTQSRKGYQLWPDCRGAVAVASKDC